MKIDECYQELQLEKDHHQQTIGMLKDICSAWYREHGEDFLFKDFPNDPRPNFLRRTLRVVWPFRLFIN
jgi:hypothetical protein